jgi:hypothetical protein
MAEYIKRRDVMKICEGYSEHCFNSSDGNGQDIADRILDDVVELPTADVVEVKHGEWVVDKDKKILHIGKTSKTRCITYKCSECGAKSGNNKSFKFCHSCGAKMKGDKND